MTLRPYQQRCSDAAINWMLKSTEPFVIEAATGCHAIDHPVLMHDGTIKAVQDIAPGDIVMSASGNRPAKVTDLHRGEDQMFLITPNKGEEFIVNGGHILSLYITPRRKGQCPEFFDISVFDYLNQNNQFKHRAKLYRVACEFSHGSDVEDAWAIGAIIGDGSIICGTPTFCTPDREVLDGISTFASSHGCEVRKMAGNRTAPTYSIFDPLSNRSTQNRVTERLRDIGIWGGKSGDKFIPQIYKTGSKKTRLDILAGLLDTDGHLNRNCYDWISKSEQLASDIVFVCRSLGLSAYMKECTKGIRSTGFSGKYFRVSISGDCSIIPCRIERKRAKPRQQIKNSAVTGFCVSPVGPGKYYGFSIDTQDRLYLDGNFVAHHNSGKSHVIADVAAKIHDRTKKRILCVAPSAELVVQNHEKFVATGSRASVFSASAGAKDLRHAVVFGTPGTIKNRISRFAMQGSSGYALVIIDEAHGITPTIKSIVNGMRSGNPNLRVMGLTATPYRLGSGYIYREDHDGKINGEDRARDPYFDKCVARVGAHELIAEGYLTPPVIGAINGERYDTSALIVNPRGQFDRAEVDRAYHGHGRKTAGIVADVVRQSAGRRGVMFFAATVQHAHEIMASLPPELSAIVTGETPKGERDSILRRFKAQQIKYVVNVSVLTVGFDAPHVDVVAILRKTESIGLLQQIVGRGLRKFNGKAECLILDYTTNLEDHCPDGDLFSPIVRALKGSSLAGGMRAVCPECGYENEFTPAVAALNAGYKIDENGYCRDLDDQLVMTDYGPMPAHTGRRCFGQIKITGKFERCGYRWTGKPCPHCNEKNDIAARYCYSCKGEIVDPNEKLLGDFKALKRDPTRTQTDRVLSMEITEGISARGNPTVRADYVTPFRSFSIWYQPQATNTRGMTEWAMFSAATQGGKNKPETLTYQKDAASGFYRAVSYNREPDQLPENLRETTDEAS